jgi:hypothetical protein
VGFYFKARHAAFLSTRLIAVHFGVSPMRPYSGLAKRRETAFSGIKKFVNNKKRQFWGRTLPPAKFSPKIPKIAGFMSFLGKMTAGFVKK